MPSSVVMWRKMVSCQWNAFKSSFHRSFGLRLMRLGETRRGRRGFDGLVKIAWGLNSKLFFKRARSLSIAHCRG
jgi:hypothetical protein